MNSANETLRSIRNQKEQITKKYNEAKERLEAKYAEDMSILNEEERKWLEQFEEVPLEDIQKGAIKKYRKKPLIIEAYQTDQEIEIETLEGTMKANVGDYIITGVKGEVYPCKPEVFNETYEEVE